MRIAWLVLAFAAVAAAATTTTTTTLLTLNGPPAGLPTRCGAVLRDVGGIRCGIPGEPSPVPPAPCPDGLACQPWDNWFCRCQPPDRP